MLESNEFAAMLCRKMARSTHCVAHCRDSVNDAFMRLNLKTEKPITRGVRYQSLLLDQAIRCLCELAVRWWNHNTCCQKLVETTRSRYCIGWNK